MSKGKILVSVLSSSEPLKSDVSGGAKQFRQSPVCTKHPLSMTSTIVSTGFLPVCNVIILVAFVCADVCITANSFFSPPIVFIGPWVGVGGDRWAHIFRRAEMGRFTCSGESLPILLTTPNPHQLEALLIVQTL